MITFFLSILFLLAGYRWYAGFIERRIFGMDNSRVTPAIAQPDNVDYIPMSWWRIFLIQFLNIAGLGPIFGAIAGAMWGPVAFLWIVLGSVFAGAVHDYLSGMLSVRHQGLSIGEIVGIYLGKPAMHVMRIFTIGLMVIVGAVFIVGPAKILTGFLPDFGSVTLWVWIIFGYYLLATLLPIDKVIGRIYPIFGFALVFMALGLITALFFNGYKIPELTLGTFRNMHSKGSEFPIFPMLFITIACGAISGFHATQSPLMARCLKEEKHGKRVFYGAMITEGVVALIWAAIGMSFFGGVGALNTTMNEQGGNAAWVVNKISNELLGTFGGLLALFGVVAAPITSGDTAFRSARLIVADIFKFDQGPFGNRLFISIPLFAVGFLLTQIDFAVIWRYFAWSNQTLATMVLWTLTAYLSQNNKPYIVTMIPALFMTAVVTTYILFAPEGLQWSYPLSVATGCSLSLVLLIWFWVSKQRRSRLNLGYSP
jgi:carbon starvation protein CstA